MTRNEIMERLKEILLFADDKNRELAAACTEDSNLMTDLGLSSVELLYVVIAVEESFQIRFENVGIGDFATVRDVVSYIEAKLQ